MKIRLANNKDKLGIHNAHMGSIQQVCSKDYNDEQIKVWGHREYNPEKRTQLIKDESIWVIEENNTILGYAEVGKLEDYAYVYGLYFLPQAIGKGFAQEMLSLMEDKAKNWGLNSLKLHSTITSLGFYTKFGFKQINGVTSVKVSNVDIPCYEMVKDLI